jgi:transcriptional regulator with XRE-family HTH domain
MVNSDHSKNLGKRLRKRRTELGYTLKELADKTVLTASFLSKIERGETTPSLNTLLKLGEILQVQVMYFMADEKETRRLLRAENRWQMELKDVETSYELLTPDLTGNFETLLIRLKPGSKNVVRPLRVDTEEMYFVLEGSLLVEIDNEEIILRKGDSLHFKNNSNLTKIVCAGQDPVTYIAVISPPVM